jgi:Protein of unknown function (Hypoth_ymh)
VDHEWARDQLREFVDRISALKTLQNFREIQFLDEEGVQIRDDIVERWGERLHVIERLVALDPVMRVLMEGARPGLGSYSEPPDGGWSVTDADYWYDIVRLQALRAIGIHDLGAEAHERMKPDSPDLVADQLHSWTWEAAAPLWFAGSRQEAVHAAARSVNARLQQKLSRYDQADAKLCREAFSADVPAAGRPRLRFPGDRTSDTWRSRQNGGMQLGAGCFEGIRNPAAHEDRLVLTEQVALEQLAAFSLLARWIDECMVETVGSTSDITGEVRHCPAARGGLAEPGV